KKDIQKEISELSKNSNSSNIECIEIDICDQSNINNLLNTLEEKYSQVDAIFHLAANLKDKSVRKNINTIDLEDFSTQLSPKVFGVNLIQKIKEKCDVKYCFLFSSLS